MPPWIINSGRKLHQFERYDIEPVLDADARPDRGQYWNLGRVYRHTANAIVAILLLWMLVFNLLRSP